METKEAKEGLKEVDSFWGQVREKYGGEIQWGDIGVMESKQWKGEFDKLEAYIAHMEKEMGNTRKKGDK